MKLFIDESGNTGETLFSNSKFNFTEQPYYVLAGILLNESTETNFQKFVIEKKTEYRIEGNELKAKKLYEKRFDFIKVIINYIVDNKIPFFIELMEKKFFIHMQMVDYFFVPYYSVPITQTSINQKRFLASYLGDYLDENVYEQFTKIVKDYTNESLESFYSFLIDYFNSINQTESAKLIESTQDDYFDVKKTEGAEEALKKFLPLPDKNPKGRLIHSLPNYSAFTNIIGRTNFFCSENGKSKFHIIHDEQKQFDIIFEEAVESMKNTDSDFLIEKLNIKGIFNIENSVNLSFVDSKDSLSVQVADLLSGVVMRFWTDFENNQKDLVDKYLPLIKKINCPYRNTNIGINYVVPIKNHEKLMKKMYF